MTDLYCPLNQCDSINRKIEDFTKTRELNNWGSYEVLRVFNLCCRSRDQTKVLQEISCRLGDATGKFLQHEESLPEWLMWMHCWF